jgi:DNA-binding Lrp family transcriptional regulator
MKAFVLIKVRAGDVREVVQQLRKVDSVVEAHMTFGPYDAIAIVESGDLGTIGSLVASTIQSLTGVEQTLTCLAIDP